MLIIIDFIFNVLISKYLFIYFKDIPVSYEMKKHYFLCNRLLALKISPNIILNKMDVLKHVIVLVIY